MPSTLFFLFWTLGLCGKAQGWAVVFASPNGVPGLRSRKNFLSPKRRVVPSASLTLEGISQKKYFAADKNHSGLTKVLINKPATGGLGRDVQRENARTRKV